MAVRLTRFLPCLGRRFGDSYHHCLVAIVVPDPEAVAAWAKANGVADTDMTTLCQNEDLKRAIFEDIRFVGKAAKLHGFEIVKAIHLEPELWTSENGVLTPTFKLKRNVAKKKYQAVITAMYV